MLLKVHRAFASDIVSLTITLSRISFGTTVLVATGAREGTIDVEVDAFAWTVASAALLSSPKDPPDGAL